MKGIILAGGSGTRLYPTTQVVSKQLLPIYDKPMIYYPLSTLMLSGIQDILIISTPDDIDRFRKLFGDGSQLGLNIAYKIQPFPDGLAQAFILGQDFIKDDSVSLILGDNIFFGHGLSEMLINSTKYVEKNNNAVIFGYGVKDPERYGVVTFNNNGKVTKIEEKPDSPDSSYAVVGLYFYPNDVIEIAKNIKPSKRGELEITDLLNMYRRKKKLSADFIGRGGAWLDTGSIEDFYKTSNFVSAIENRQGFKIACIEEIALNNKWINKKHIKNSIKFYGSCNYSDYLKKLI